MDGVALKSRVYFMILVLVLLFAPTILAGEQHGSQATRPRLVIESEWQSVQCPDPPRVGVSSDPCIGQTVVWWTSVEEATLYIVERDDDAGFSSPEEVYRGTGRDLYYTSPEGRYCFRVKAETDSCTTAWSNVECGELGPRWEAPILHPINNPGGDGSYEVRWGSGQAFVASLSLVANWHLQEDTSPSFPHPADYWPDHDYLGFGGKAPGTYYYRVRTDMRHCVPSHWSSVQSVTVLEPVQYWFNGYVYDDDTDEGIPGVTVKLYRWTGTEWSEINSKTTSESGLFGLYASAQSGKYALAETNSAEYESTRAEAPAGFDAEVVNADRIEFDDPPLGVVGPSLFYDARAPTPTLSATPTATQSITATHTPTFTATPMGTPSTTPIATNTATITSPPDVYLPLVLKRPVV